jgi:serralysin
MTGTAHTLSTVTKSSLAMANGILTGLAWSGTITYAFPTSASDYSYTTESSNGFAAISSAQQTAALFALEVDNGNSADDGFSVEGFTLSTFESGTASSSTLRFAQSNGPATAYAYFPTTAAQGGDTWFGTAYDYTAPEAGNYAWHTMLHELGHALGLKHSHEKYGAYGVMAAANDAVEYTVMSYKAYVGAKPTGYTYSYSSAPQTYMMADIAALQQMYGADYSTNSGNTVYSWDATSGNTLVNGEVAIDAAGTVIFATIWDGGGNDTYDLSAYTTDLKLNLDAGKSSYFNVDQIAVLGSKKYATGNIYNALLYNKDTASLIENAYGGSGNDTINGNLLANVLLGNGGNNKIYGFDGNDLLGGGDGNNVIDGGLGNDTIIVGNGTNTIIGGLGDDMINAGSGTNAITDLSGNNVIGSFGGGTVKTGSGNDSITMGNGVNTITDTGGNNSIFTGSGADKITSAKGNDWIAAGDGDNIVTDSGGTNVVYGGSGIDKITMSTGNDAIFGDSGADIIIDKGGANSIYGDGGNDTITGGIGIDTIYGGQDIDKLTGGAGNDMLYGEGGADIISGGLGNDIISGGDGADVFAFEAMAAIGKDVITDFDYVSDFLKLTVVTMKAQVVSAARQVGDDTVITFSSTASLTLTDFDVGNADEIQFV